MTSISTKYQNKVEHLKSALRSHPYPCTVTSEYSDIFKSRGVPGRVIFGADIPWKSVLNRDYPSVTTIITVNDLRVNVWLNLT